MNATVFFTKNVLNEINAHKGTTGSSSSYYGIIEPEDYSSETPTPLYKDVTGTDYMYYRIGSVSSSEYALHRCDVKIFADIKFNYDAYNWKCGINGSQLDENSYVADESVTAFISKTYTYYPNSGIFTLTITNSSESAITFDQVHCNAVSSAYTNSRNSASGSNITVLLGGFIFDEAVTLQPNGSITIKYKIA